MSILTVFVKVGRVFPRALGGAPEVLGSVWLVPVELAARERLAGSAHRQTLLRWFLKLGFDRYETGSYTKGVCGTRVDCTPHQARGVRRGARRQRGGRKARRLQCHGPLPPRSGKLLCRKLQRRVGQLQASILARRKHDVDSEVRSGAVGLRPSAKGDGSCHTRCSFSGCLGSRLSNKLAPLRKIEDFSGDFLIGFALVPMDF